MTKYVLGHGIYRYISFSTSQFAINSVGIII